MPLSPRFSPFCATSRVFVAPGLWTWLAMRHHTLGSVDVHFWRWSALAFAGFLHAANQRVTFSVGACFWNLCPRRPLVLPQSSLGGSDSEAGSRRGSRGDASSGVGGSARSGDARRGRGGVKRDRDGSSSDAANPGSSSLDDGDEVVNVQIRDLLEYVTVVAWRDWECQTRVVFVTTPL